MMEQITLESAQTAFLALLAQVDPVDSMDFVQWVCQQCTEFFPSGNDDDNIENNSSDDEGEDMIDQIIKDLRQIVPIDGTMPSEKINFPDSGHNADLRQSTTLHIDGFLYDDNEIDQLCDEGKLSRMYCTECGSHKTKLLDFISHSTSPEELHHIFNDSLPSLLPNLQDANLVDVGSRLGAVLYGAYYYSPVQSICGVEINQELCDTQQQIINKYHMGSRVKIKCADICNEGLLLKEADIVVLNNVFEFFLPIDIQINTWKFLRSHITKPGCILVTVPSLEEATTISKNNQPVVDLENWVECINCKATETKKISFYRVK